MSLSLSFDVVEVADRVDRLPLFYLKLYTRSKRFWISKSNLASILKFKTEWVEVEKKEI